MTSNRVQMVLIPVALSASLSAGCLFTTRSTGNQLRETSANHEERLSTLEANLSEERNQLQRDLAKANAQILELDGLTKEATERVRRNSADLGLEVEQLREQLAILEGQIAEVRNQSESSAREFSRSRIELEKRVDVVARKAGIDFSVPDSEIPADRQSHFTASENAYQNQDYSKCRALFRAYAERYPQDERTDDAHYFIGQSYLDEGRPASALGAFRSVITDHPRGDRADDALLAMGTAFFTLHACTDARTALQALLSGYPRSPLRTQARAKLREVQRSTPNYCTS
ncbi:MAG: tetratricopeptide repeat protein [Myxococcota bacterium]